MHDKQAIATRTARPEEHDAPTIFRSFGLFVITIFIFIWPRAQPDRALEPYRPKMTFGITTRPIGKPRLNVLRQYMLFCGSDGGIGGKIIAVLATKRTWSTRRTRRGLGMSVRALHALLYSMLNIRFGTAKLADLG